MCASAMRGPMTSVRRTDAIVLVGWNDAEQCWIVKNSWGPAWGMAGYFKIKWGECNIGQNVIHIEPDRDGVRVRLRVDGVLRLHQTLPARMAMTAAIRICMLGE